MDDIAKVWDDILNAVKKLADYEQQLHGEPCECEQQLQQHKEQQQPVNTGRGRMNNNFLLNFDNDDQSIYDEPALTLWLVIGVEHKAYKAENGQKCF
jgi:hypothetical protein